MTLVRARFSLVIEQGARVSLAIWISNVGLLWLQIILKESSPLSDTYFSKIIIINPSTKAMCKKFKPFKIYNPLVLIYPKFYPNWSWSYYWIEHEYNILKQKTKRIFTCDQFDGGPSSNE